MRLNKWIAANTTYSRRGADELIGSGRVIVNGKTASMGMQVEPGDAVHVDQKLVHERKAASFTLMINKPVGYVCSRKGQGAPTVYSLLPLKYHHLDIVGRLDKESSGLLLLTSDGVLHQQLTHPSYQKEKRYTVALDKPLKPQDEEVILTGVTLSDGMSKLVLGTIGNARLEWEVRMHEGRNRQIRRTFAVLGYTITGLHRTQFGPYKLGRLEIGKISEVTVEA